MKSLNTKKIQYGERAFTAKELDRSIPLDTRRLMRGEQGEAFLAAILSVVRAQEERKRARKAADARSFEDSASCLFANIVVAARNRIDSRRFVAVSFNRNDYVGAKLSIAAISTLRDKLLRLGLIEGQTGYARGASSFLGVDHARRSRLRATPTLLQLFEDHGVDRGSVGWRTERDVIVIKGLDEDVGPEPERVTASRAVLLDTNTRLVSAEIALPGDAWERVALRYRSELAGDAATANERAYAGDLTASYLYRSFKGGWDRGGRIYGGWWINLPKVERKNLTINNMPVVELDYGRLHPTILFARAGIRLDFDPYSIPGLEGPSVRELGKRTFNRLINRVPAKSGRLVPFVASSQDRSDLPNGVTFQEFLVRFVERLRPVAPWFGTGVGVELQREDSELAVGVLQKLGASEIVVLPVHDSFIVTAENRDILRDAMASVFQEKYGFTPVIG